MGAILAELPRVTPNYDTIAAAVADGSVTCATGTSINTAIASAVTTLQGLGAGKIVDVLLAASGSYSGETITLVKHGVTNGWIRIKTNTTLPASGTRILPSTGTTLATVTIPDGANGVIPAAGAQGYMIEGVKFVASTTQDTHAFITFTPAAGVNAVGDIASRMSIRHVWIAGNAATQTRRFGVVASAQMLEIVDSYLVHFNMNGVDYSQQSQAITVPSGLGKLRIENNVLWRSSEGIAFGGANQFSPFGQSGLQMLPSDITIRKNHIYMPTSYAGTTAPAEMCANGLEFKQARRVLIENNIVENVWTDSQGGYGLVMWSVNQPGSGESFIDTCDFTVRFNWFKNCASMIENPSIYDPVNEPSIYPRRFNIHDNLATGYGQADTNSPANGSTTAHLHTAQAGSSDIRFVNNTAIGSDSSTVLNMDPSQYTRYEFRDNVLGASSGHTLHTSSGEGDLGWNLMNAGGDCLFTGNVVWDTLGTTPNAANNSIVAAIADIGFADSTKATASTVTYAQLSALEISGAHAGKGCDVATLITNLSGVECASADLPT